MRRWLAFERASASLCVAFGSNAKVHGAPIDLARFQESSEVFVPTVSLPPLKISVGVWLSALDGSPAFAW